ncbi:MAG TPA: hypothetical protein IAA80_06550 [Candidatus Gallacutalibacter pullistercoris]|nr:hypothetical protein [Candidatus Gallacutalibacter pullistercoris]
MINVFIGKKGSGKTKKLIDYANKAVETSNGNVVVIEKGLKLTYDITHKARLIDSDAYGIKGLDALEGFLCGICAGNYDVTDILLDSTLKIIGQDMAALTDLIVKVKKLSEETNVTFTLSISADESEIPADVLAMVNTI